MSRSFKLYRLQQIDSQLDVIQNRLTEIEKLLVEDAVVQQAQNDAAEKEAVFQAAQKRLHRAEDEVRAQRVKIEQSESSLYGGKIRIPKELKDLENEVAALKRYLGALEDRQLEAMMLEEEAAAQQQSSRRELEQTRQAFEARCADLNQERERIRKDRQRLEAERDASAAAIPSADQDLYNQIRKARRGVAVAKVTDRACSACGSTLNASLLNAAHTPTEVHRCEVCGRILYTG